MRHAFSKDYKLVAGQASPEDSLSTAEYPASGSFVDVSGYDTVDIVVHLGEIHGSDTPIFKIQQSDSVSGTMDTIDTTNCKKTCAGTDDDQALMFHLEVAQLATDHHFITVDVSGVSNGSYGDILYFLHGKSLPVTQDTTLVPSDNQFIKAG